MDFPIVVLKKGEAPIYFFDETKFGLVSKGGETFYKHGNIYDASSNEFSLNGFRFLKTASFIKSLLHFQQMYLVEPICNDIQKITLSQLKEILVVHINSNKQYWIQKDLIDNLLIGINSSASFGELFGFIK